MQSDKNTILIGNPNNFSIAYSLNDDYAGKWLLGKVCYIINDIVIGDWESGTTLCTIVSDLSQMHGDSRNEYYHGRKEDGFFTMPIPELLRHIHGYKNDKSSPLYSIANDRCYARFDITLDDSTMEDWKVYLVEDEKNEDDNSRLARIIVLKQIGSSKRFELLFEHYIRNEEFCVAVERAYNDIFMLYERELKY